MSPPRVHGGVPALQIRSLPKIVTLPTSNFLYLDRYCSQEEELSLWPPPPLPETMQLFKVGTESSGQRERESSDPARYKGVVPQQNGHWGAQIYVHHSRIWLGTFKSERAAARAYDSAAIKLHRCVSHRNFPCSDTSVHEPAFQDLFTKDAVLEMIKDGSYEPKLADFVRANNSVESSALPPPPTSAAGVICREMFQKELTPSDVGKLNRLVIPKKHATRHLPPVSSDAVEELLLEFRDRGNRGWVFRYCYWKSSQSYVFTKGWNKFVKEKGLRAKDTVGFYRCESRGGLRQSYCMVDVVRCDGTTTGAGAGSLVVENVEGTDQLPYGCDDDEVMSAPIMDVDEISDQEKKEMKLFGVWIG
ncbi:AP2/ERF and B3 domain-containing transcription factor [Platanthera zijinensis]|uniref:AP2/ERF and B3 domain-containing transcription factor n=1 Tax=Platanthera zijinensis TaxID=2320716 RepID=A0AAP0BN63_9ASPA